MMVKEGLKNWDDSCYHQYIQNKKNFNHGQSFNPTAFSIIIKKIIAI